MNVQILVVDDDADLRDAMVETIEDRGYIVAAACDGHHALEYLRENPLPRLILADMKMPRMNGIELVVELQKDARLAATPVVLVTAQPGVEAEVGPLPVTGYLVKPFKVEELFDLLRRMVGEPP